MKTTRFLFTMIAFGVLRLGVGFAGEPPQQPSEQDSHVNHAASVRPAGPMPGKQTPGKAELPDAEPSNTKDESPISAHNSPAGPFGPQPQSTPAIKLPQSAPKASAPSPKAGLPAVGFMRNRTEIQPPPKLPVASGTTAPKPGAVRGRSDAPAAIGGSKASGAKNPVAVLDGASFKLKP
jgi:hypothetical protein